jgi:hypothetical protein
MRSKTPCPSDYAVRVPFRVALVTLAVSCIVLLQGLCLVKFATSAAVDLSIASIDAPRYVKAERDPDPTNQSMTYITLTYGPMSEGYSSNIMHNCLMINQAKGNNTFIVFTDQPMNKEYCKHCHCQKFERYNCKCPISNCTDRKNACEKNHFFSDMMLRYPEFILLDHDLVIVKPSFFGALYSRTRHHDFLAARDQGPGMLGRYKKTFNSGLVFIRRLPNVDPMLLRDYLYTKNTLNYDQSTLSTFIFLHYTNWDELSIRWHCRALPAYHRDVPYEDCYTLHPPFEAAVEELKFKLLTP